MIFDPTAKSIKALETPATPTFFLIDSTGTLRNLWMGFDIKSSGKLRDDVLAAIAALKN